MVLSGKDLTAYRNEDVLFQGLSFCLFPQQLMTITGPKWDWEIYITQNHCWAI